ncbi:acetyl/propionyl-CoA carboxylase alpha subunit [Ensifer sp. 4252]
MKLRSVLVANRGEIAVRIIRAAKALGIRTIQVYSAADADMLAVKLADEAIEIGPPAPKKSYLDIAAVISAAKRANVDAVHPGYGFLSENGDFADAVVAAGLIFIGPSGDAIRLLGDKVAARAVAEKAGVPTVPGSDGRISSLADALEVTERTGFPVMIKAAAGGGGRGIRIVNNAAELDTQFPQASAEALASFGDGGLYLEKVITRARHVEVQILGDGQNVVHCYERECSLQRRRQKVWEEAPSFLLPPEVRQKLCDSAVALARSVGYRGAGTVEYLYDDETREFYFIEVNTRIQVEHPVTESPASIWSKRCSASPPAHRSRSARPASPSRAMLSNAASMPRIRGAVSCRRRAGSKDLKCLRVRASVSTPCSTKATSFRRSTIHCSAN